MAVASGRIGDPDNKPRPQSREPVIVKVPQRDHTQLVYRALLARGGRAGVRQPLAVEQSAQLGEWPCALPTGEHQPIVIVDAGAHRTRKLSNRFLEGAAFSSGKPSAELDLYEHAPAVAQRNHEIIDRILALGSDCYSNGTGYLKPDVVKWSLRDDDAPYECTDTRAQLGSLLVARTTEWSSRRLLWPLAHQAMLGTTIRLDMAQPVAASLREVPRISCERIDPFFGPASWDEVREEISVGELSSRRGLSVDSKSHAHANEGL